MTSFSKQIAAYVDKYERRLRATARGSVQATVNKAQVPVAKGGRMRVKYGFLRASIQAAIGQMPSGPTTNEGLKEYKDGDQVAGEDVSTVLLKWDPADGPIFVGWTANYARPREYHDGFMRGATEQWTDTVGQVAQVVRRTI